jgi:hypothetical protein
MRYFRASVAVYESICSQLDAAYGYPNGETKTERTLPLASELPTDGQGRVYLAASQEYCDYILPGQMLPELLASGAVEEVDTATYAALLPESPSPVS